MYCEEALPAEMLQADWSVSASNIMAHGKETAQSARFELSATSARTRRR